MQKLTSKEALRLASIYTRKAQNLRDAPGNFEGEARLYDRATRVARLKAQVLAQQESLQLSALQKAFKFHPIRTANS